MATQPEFQRKGYAYRDKETGRLRPINTYGFPFLMWARPEPEFVDGPFVEAVRVEVTVRILPEKKKRAATKPRKR